MFGNMPKYVGCCGCYFTVAVSNFGVPVLERRYLPLVEQSTHVHVQSTAAKHTLTQIFVNHDDVPRSELSYIFPLYDGVAVTAFKCVIGDKVIEGSVKARDEAKRTFEKAVQDGKAAALVEQDMDMGDVFKTSIGNVPAKSKFVVEITYVGELATEDSANSIRLTIPNIIAPRYGDRSVSWGQQNQTGPVSITVDVDMPDGTFVKSLSSPSHPISLALGSLSTSGKNAVPSSAKASATLSSGTMSFVKDFVLQIITQTTDTPRALLETHPTIPGSRALMASLVPRFNLPQQRPEIVFICDRSGSMGNKMATVVSALKIFFKSLPVGVMFNICSFGSGHSFLWGKSKPYNRENLDAAMAHLFGFAANFGGTEMLKPIRATVENRHEDLPLEILLLTDGEITAQQELFEYIGEARQAAKQPIRVFPLGIGDDTSSALIQGVARAGQGFAQEVSTEEKLDSKIVRMLKGALSPHISDYAFEVRYENDEVADDDDFEIVTKMEDCLILEDDETSPVTNTREKDTTKEKPKTISLFDEGTVPEDTEKMHSEEPSAGKYDHLPSLSIPPVMQAPFKTPALFPFIRFTVYLLFSPSAPQKTPKSVVITGTSPKGKLELDIPVQVLAQPDDTIHKMAARKAILELEESRGYLFSARDKDGARFYTKYPGQFPQMVEREAVRLGVTYQVQSRYTSFVAVERDEKTDDAQLREALNKVTSEAVDTAIRNHPIASEKGQAASSAGAQAAAANFMGFGSMDIDALASPPLLQASQSPMPEMARTRTASAAMDMSPHLYGSRAGPPAAAPAPPPPAGAAVPFGSAAPSSNSTAAARSTPQATFTSSGSSFGPGVAARNASNDPGSSSLFGGANRSAGSSLFGNSNASGGFGQAARSGAVFGNDNYMMNIETELGAVLSENPGRTILHMDGTVGNRASQQEAKVIKGPSFDRMADRSANTGSSLFGQANSTVGSSLFGRSSYSNTLTGSRLFGINNNQGNITSESSLFGINNNQGNTNAGSSLFGNNNQQGNTFGKPALGNAPPSTTGSSLFSNAQPSQSSLFGAPSSNTISTTGFGSQDAAAQQSQQQQQRDRKAVGMALRGGPASAMGSSLFRSQFGPSDTTSTVESVSKDEPVRYLISLQTFEGYWPVDVEGMWEVLGVKASSAFARFRDMLSLSSSEEISEEQKIFVATVSVVKFLETQHADDEETWDLVVEKARGWLETQGLEEEDPIWKEARDMLHNAARLRKIT